MSKNSKDKSSDNEKNTGKREIKQVFITDEGKEKSEVSKSVKTEQHKDNKTSEPEHKHTVHEAEHKERKVVRIIALSVVMLSSLLLAMCVGAVLAIWDSGRTISEFNAILLGREVAATSAITYEESETPSDEDDEEASWSDEEEDANDDEAGEDQESEEPEDEEDDYGNTISSDTEGIEGVSRAGSGDEIENHRDEEPEAIKDPLADYPLPFTTVDESYFTDALFIGDSRLQGFGFWSGLPATYYCATGFQLYKYDTTNVVQTEKGKVPIFEAMPYDAFTKIYIKVGLNELGYGTEENFEKTYAGLIEKLREYEPRAIIYVHAILPVTAEKSEKDKAHNNPNIQVRNESLKKFAKDQKAYFLDAGPALAGADGSLPSEMTNDGIHLKPEYMKIWKDYLCEHAVVIE
ncbi:MAG: hypothetical protein J5910_04340 [Lachnospiraceae bacterium]|nr:hypothetical protein [Lachnospiraceae bacterium]